MVRAGRPMLIFDGDCGFCTSSANWLASGWASEADVVAWQRLDPSRLDELGITVEQCREAAFWVDPSGRVRSGHQAIAGALAWGSGWRRPAGGLLASPLVGPVARIVYRMVARNRYRMPGGTPACRIPTDPS